ncbi:MAG: hypothetical protein JWO19_3151 [Bryobacterales bacterium]|nr:hypothetical protein [Bryobacterales bacterium]
MCILLVESVVSESSSHAGGLSTGIICALLLFLKVNLFVIAAGLVGMSLLLNWDVRRFRGMAVGFFLVAAAIATYLRFNLAAMWRDFRMAAEGRGTSVSVSRLISLMELNWFTLVITMLLAVFIASDKKAEDLKSRYRYPILCLAVFGASALLLITNFQPSAMPLGVVFALICCSRLYTLWKHGRHLKSMASMWLVFCASGFIMYSMGIDTMSIVHAGVLRHFSGRFLLTPFDADALSPFVTFGPKDPPERPVDGQWLVQYVNDGLALLRENTSPWDSVVSLDYANPFSFALKRPPNEGGAVWLAFGDPTFRYNPEPSMILGRAAVVMIPKWPTAIRSDFEGGLRVYGTYVKEHFNKAAESKLWILEKRNEVP